MLNVQNRGIRGAVLSRDFFLFFIFLIIQRPRVDRLVTQIQTLDFVGLSENALDLSRTLFYRMHPVHSYIRALHFCSFYILFHSFIESNLDSFKHTTHILSQ